ncbi:MAG TPA: hypothetical protein DIC36_05655 [Gammaproteobacteria bacterium]|nr:hypothetical protein [Gammaproteobacteria bacterium]
MNDHTRKWRWSRVLLLTGLALLAGCGTIGSQVVPTTVHKTLSLKTGDLQRDGLAFLTPSTVTGQEQDKLALALVFGETVAKLLPGVRVVSLPETLGAINRAGLADEYRVMIDHYRDTAIFRRDSLKAIGQAASVRYLAQLKLAEFRRDLRERFSLFGLRLFQTQYAHLRLDMQIWDSVEGVIAWEASEEVNYAYDSGSERPVTFQQMVEVAAAELLKTLP